MNHLQAPRHAKKAKIVIDDEEDEWDEGIDMKKKVKEESGASEDDDLADSSSEEELDSESDGEHSAKRIRLKKGGQTAAKSVGSLSRPPLAPVKIYNSTPLQSQKLSNTTPAQKQSTSSVYDRCSAQKGGSTDLQSNVSTPCSNDSPGSNSSTPSMPVLPEGVVGRGSHEHNTFDFLHPNMRKDKDGNRPDSLKYNPRTCFVPQSFVLKQTPAMAQWWILKQDNMDTVLFFKVQYSTIMTIHTILYINICMYMYIFILLFI